MSVISSDSKNLHEHGRYGPKINILGVGITRMNLQQAIKAAERAIEQDRKLFAVVPNVFVICECRRDAAYREAINSADIAFADGMPLVWASYLYGQYTGGRASGADFFSRFTEIAAKKGYSCYFLGGGPGGSERVAANVQCRCRGIKIVGNFSPPLGEIPEKMTDEIVNEINSVKPDILWVGLGAPRQEKWIYHSFSRLNVKLAIGIGAAFDYEAGKRRRAPRWMQKAGLEWSFRILFENPELLWKKRYYAYLWEFITPIFFEVAKKHLNIFRSPRRT